MAKTPEYTVSSGNIFADLGVKNPEEMLLRADLAITIEKIIKKRKWTQQQAGDFLGIAQAEISEIIRGNIDHFTIERLLRFVRMLDRDIKITVEHIPKSRNEGRYKYKDDLRASL